MINALTSPISLPLSGMHAVSRAFVEQSQQGGFDALLDSFTSGNAKKSSTGLDSLINIAGFDNDVAAGGDALWNFMQQIVGGVENSFENMGFVDPVAPVSPVDAVNAASTIAYARATIAIGGPLPAFIKEVSAQRHLNTTQQLALWEIARENKDVIKTPYTVEKIARELQEAGF